MITKGELIHLVKTAYSEGYFDSAVSRENNYDQSIIKIAVDKIIKDEVKK